MQEGEMADPLRKDAFRSVTIAEELDETRGRVSRTDLNMDMASPDRQLPEAGNPRLNRAAEQVGGAVGRVVSQARRVPDSAWEKLHLVRDRAEQAKDAVSNRISSSASSLADTAEQRARSLVGTTQEKARDLMDRVEERGRVAFDEVDQLSRRAAERASEIKDRIEEQSRELRLQARLRAEQMRRRAQRLVHEHPLEVLGGIAGAALLAGVSLRIVRAHNARRH